MLKYPNAKINLGLNVLRKLEDGYHEIESCFYPVMDIIDALEFIPSTEDDFQCLGTDLDISPKDNLVTKAYTALRSKSTFPNQNIYLYKRIPSGGGLGGGSSDAAFTLTMLNEKYSLGLSENELSAMAKNLGADVPFFLYNKPCIAGGIGEKLSPVDLDLSAYHIQLYFPEIQISTAWAFSQITPKPWDKDLSTIISKPISTWKNSLHNDFEKVVFSAFPELAQMKEKIYDEGAIYASMSGTGSTMYGIFPRES